MINCVKQAMQISVDDLAELVRRLPMGCSLHALCVYCRYVCYSQTLNFDSVMYPNIVNI